MTFRACLWSGQRDNIDMKIDLHNLRGEFLTRVDCQPGNLPPVVHVERGGRTEEHYLDWDRAFDDEGHLRKCPACECDALYIVRVFPTLSVIIFIMLIALACMVLYGVTDTPLGPMVMGVIAVIVVHLFFKFYSPRHLVCYRCSSRFEGVKISQERKEWDTAESQMHRARP